MTIVAFVNTDTTYNKPVRTYSSETFYFTLYRLEDISYVVHTPIVTLKNKIKTSRDKVFTVTDGAETFDCVDVVTYGDLVQEYKQNPILERIDKMLK